LKAGKGVFATHDRSNETFRRAILAATASGLRCVHGCVNVPGKQELAVLRCGEDDHGVAEGDRRLCDQVVYIYGSKGTYPVPPVACIVTVRLAVEVVHVAPALR
jgi:hypothetical protein